MFFLTMFVECVICSAAIHASDGGHGRQDSDTQLQEEGLFVSSTETQLT